MVQLQSEQLQRTSPDQRIVHSGISWEQFQGIRSGFGDRRNVQLFYYQNTVEILMPGRDRELFSRLIGFLIGLYCLEMGIEFEPLGSTAQEREGVVAVEPDESYCFGNSKPTPDLAIEVIFTSGSLNKLQRYRALGISEVWFWEDGVFSLYRLRDEDYQAIPRSEISELSDLDMELFARCVLMAQTSRLEAAKTFRESI